MKKKYIIMVIAIVIALLMLIFWFTGTNVMKKKVELNYWNDPYARYMVCKAKITDKVYNSYTYCSATLETGLTKDEIVETNKEDYIGEITFIDECLEHSASLFYHNNNYYVLYYDEINKFYRIQDCYLAYQYKISSDVYIPSPVYLNISEECIQMDIENGCNTLDYLFDNYSFEEAKEFYSRLSEEYVEINEEKSQIAIDGYAVRTKEMRDKCIIIDFANRVILGLDEQGNYNTITGIE